MQNSTSGFHKKIISILSFYQGKDNSSYSKDSTQRYGINYKLDYGNQAVALRWNHLFSQKVFSNTSVIYNNYYHDVTATQKPYYAELYSGIRDIDIKSDFSYYPSMNHKISAGVNYLHQTLSPATILDKSLATDTSSAIVPSDIPKKYSNRIAVYFGDEFWFTPKFNIYLGARVPLYMAGDVHYLQFEPRLALMRILNASTSIKISYTQMHQFLNLVQSYNAAFPAQIWIGSGQNCKTTKLPGGIHWDYLRISGKICFNSALKCIISRWETRLCSKKDRLLILTVIWITSSFLEKDRAMAQNFIWAKTQGKLTGWLAYTLSYANQQFDSLNLGKQFPFAYDRRHSLYIIRWI